VATATTATFPVSLDLRIDLMRFTKSSFTGIGAWAESSVVPKLETALGRAL